MAGRIGRRRSVRRSAWWTAVLLVGQVGLAGAYFANESTAVTPSPVLITPTSLDFGALPLGEHSAGQAVAVRNISGAPITLSGSGGGASSPFVSNTSNCHGTLAVGAVCFMFYAYVPSALGAQTGSVTGIWNGQSYTVGLSGSGLPQLSIGPTALDFGDVPLGRAGTVQRVAIHNLANTPVTMSGAGGGAGALFGGSQDCQGKVLKPRGTCHMYYQYRPSALGPETSTTSGNWNGQQFSFSFAGNGVSSVPGTAEFVPVRPLPLHVASSSHRPTRSGARLTRNVRVQVADAGAAQVAPDAAAVVLSVTTTGAKHVGQVVVRGCGAQAPKDPMLQVARKARSSAVTVSQLGAGGAVCLTSSTPAHLSASLLGWFPSSSSITGVPADRVLHTARPHVGSTGSPRAGATLHVKVGTLAAPNYIPPNAGGAVLSLTASHAAHDGSVTVWPCGTARPADPTLQVRASASSTVMTVSRLDPTGDVCVHTTARTDLSMDALGWLGSTTPTTLVASERLLSTAHPQTGYTGGKPNAGKTVHLHVAGAGSPAVPLDATAVILDVAAGPAAKSGGVTVWPCGGTRTGAATLSLRAHSTTSLTTIVPLGGGTVCLHTSRSANLTADVLGWFPGTISSLP